MIVKLGKDNKLTLIILIALFILGAVILTNTLSFFKIENVMINQVRENQMTKNEFTAIQIENHILQVKDELVTLSKFPPMKKIDINSCSGDMKIIHEKLDGKIDSLLRVDKYGQVIECSEKEYSDYLGLNIKNKDYFKTPKETNEPYIAGMVRHGEHQQIIISAPLFETNTYTPYPNFLGKFEGVLMSIIELDQLYNLYIHPILEKDRNYYLLINVDTKETLLKSKEINNFSEIINKLPKSNKGLNIITDFNGFGKTIITSSDIILEQRTWRLIVLTPLKNIGKEITSVQRRHLFSLGFLTIVIAGALFFLFSLYRSREEVQSKLDKVKVTLDKLGINVEVEEKKYNQSDIILNTKKMYLIKEDDENQAYELFIGSLNRGFAGLGIIREDPREIKQKYNLEKTPFIWLNKNNVKGQACETDINNLFKLILEFMQKSEKSVILIDRLDYIISENEFDKVLKKIHELKDLASTKESIIILSLNPEVVNETQIKAIETETIDLYGKHLRKKVELTDLELNILRLINEKNITNKLVPYKEITQKFNITKPTTRVKINKLQGLGLIQVEHRGRFKSLKITSAGRKIIN